ncbi:MAG TPA: hypothetical protein VJP40_02175 [bacterium]|nr:hypothetical protein [bacterium]
MRILKQISVLSTIAALLPLFGVYAPKTAAAYGNSPMHITPVFARAEAQPTSLEVSTCEGADGVYTVLHVTSQGPITSNDPRLEGTFYGDAIAITNAQGKGISRDNFKIHDPVTGKLKMKGTGYGIHSDPNPIHAQAFGRLADGTRFWSESTVWLPAPGTQDPIIVEYGGEGSGDTPDRGVTISGSCQALLDAFGD